MSKQMKILSGVVGVLVLAAVVLTMFGKPPNLPIPGLQGMLAKDDAAATDGTVDAAADPGLGAVNPDCTGAAGATTPGSGTGATDPAAGGAVDPAAGGAADPAAGGAADPAAGGATGATDPATGAPVASAADGWTGGDRVLAAGEGSYDPGRVSDTVILAADAVDPAAAGAVDPAAAGAVDPAAAGAADPAAAGAVDPAAAGAADPAAAGAADPAAAGAGATTDPCAGAAGAGAVTDPAAGAAGTVDPAAGAGATTPGATGATGAGGTAAATAKTTTDGANTGNSPEALRAAKDATTVMQKAKITVTTTATLVPSVGGTGRPAALKRYRATVTAAVLVMKLDQSAQEQWTTAGKKVQIQLVKSFLTRLGKSYARSARSITVTDASGTVLAIGDAAPRKAPAVKLF